MTTKTEVNTVNKAIIMFFKQLNNRYYKTIPNIRQKNNKFYDAQTPDGVEDWIDIKGLWKLRKGLIGIRKAGFSDNIKMITESQLKDDFVQIKKSDILLIMSFVKK